MEGILKELVFALGFEIRKASPYYQFLLYFSNVFFRVIPKASMFRNELRTPQSLMLLEKRGILLQTKISM